MRYYKIENNIPVEYSIEQLLEDHPGAQICDVFLGELSENMLKNYNVYRLIECPKIDSDNCTEGTPILQNDILIQTWIDNDTQQENS